MHSVMRRLAFCLGYLALAVIGIVETKWLKVPTPGWRFAVYVIVAIVDIGGDPGVRGPTSGPIESRIIPYFGGR